MPERSAELLGIAHAKLRRGADQHARVADLSAALRIERGMVQYDLPLLTDPQFLDQSTIEDQRGHAPEPASRS